MSRSCGGGAAMGVRMAAKRRRGWLGDLSSHMMCRCALTFFGDVKVQSGKRLWWWGEAKGEPPDGPGRGTCTLERTGPHWPPRVPSLDHLRCYFQQQKCVLASQIVCRPHTTVCYYCLLLVKKYVLLVLSVKFLCPRRALLG